MIAALVRHLFDSTVFAGFLTLFPILMRKRSAAARHAVWLLAASKFALPVALFSAAGIRLRSFFPTHQVFLTSSTALPSFLLPAASARIGSGTTPWVSTLILGIWLGGTVLMFAVWLRGFLAPVGSSAPASDGEAEALACLQHRIGLHRKVALRCIESKAEPAVKGIWRLTITLPRGLSTLLEPQEFESVLLHELAHAKRRDNLTISVVHALVCIFWFHPLLWWIERRLIAEQELACDEFVLGHGPTREEYASGLLKICRFHLAGPLPGVCGIGGPNLKRRMEAIMSFKPSHLNQRAPRFLVGTLILAMTILPLSLGFLAAPPAFGQASKVGYSAYSKPAVTCTWAGKDYPLGGVIQLGLANKILSGQRMCVEDSNGRPFWTPTNAEARHRSQRVITLQSPPPVFCEPAASSSPKYCACQGGLFSIGAIVNSSSGKLRCDNGKWRPATPAELGLREKK